MIEFKACPRCKGDLHTTSDYFGGFKECLQCGHVIELDTPATLVARLRQGRARRGSAA